LKRNDAYRINLTPETVADRNEIHLSLSIQNFEDITHNELTELIGIEPERIHIKGEIVRPGYLRPLNEWFLGSGHDRYTPFAIQMNSLLDIIEARMDAFKMLSDKYTCWFNCALYIYPDNGESIPSVHLDTRYNQVMGNLNIEFDLDLYCLPVS
jgi:hypothetical protein